MLKTFFSGMEWERHCHQMGLAAGVEGEEEEEEEGGGRARGRRRGKKSEEWAQKKSDRERV